MSKPEILKLKERTDEIDRKIVGTVLYENKTGTTGNITLSDSVANYDYIEIQGTRLGTGMFSSGRLYNVNGKTISIGTTYTDANDIYVYSKTITLNAKKINVVRANLGFFNSTRSQFVTDDGNYITRVVGYKVL